MTELSKTRKALKAKRSLYRVACEELAGSQDVSPSLTLRRNRFEISPTL